MLTVHKICIVPIDYKGKRTCNSVNRKFKLFPFIVAVVSEGGAPEEARHVCYVSINIPKTKNCQYES